MKTLFTFFLIFTFCLCVTIKAKAQVNVKDSLALVDLYNSTNGPSWYNHSGWLTTDPVSTWRGITVTGTRVTGLYLDDNNLIGTIPSSIGNLVKLTSIDLGFNQLSGSIPSSIGNLVNLQYLYLHFNQLIGSIPSSIGNLVNLRELWLYVNQLIGSIPSSIGNLVNLQYLELEVNKLSGSIPSSIGNLVNLHDLQLNNNQLSGSIPSSIGNLVNLQYLELYANQLIGSIPSSIGNLVNLRLLWLHNNQLSGSIPSSIGNLVNLQVLYLYINQLSGSIPSSIGNLVHATNMNLGQNQLSGSIPSSIGNLVNLRQLYLNNNQLSGEIPLPKNKLKYLTYVDISYNQLVQNTNIEYSSNPNRPGRVNNNLFTFNGIEYIAQKFPKVVYAPQAIIPLHQHGNALSVYAGGTLSKNTYKWYKNGSLIATKSADSTFQPEQSGKYYASVTNAVATKLTLYSDTVDFTINDNRLSADANSSELKQGLQVYPNPANSVVQVQVNGTATISLTNSAGKVMLTRTITNNAFINVKSFAPGTYYIQNKDNDEVKKVVVTH
jgi:Leucine-rich repeat (LRR) protein